MGCTLSSDEKRAAARTKQIDRQLKYDYERVSKVYIGIFECENSTTVEKFYQSSHRKSGGIKFQIDETIVRK